jgi:hypothetical protein
MCPFVIEQTQTSSQAGGMTSASMRARTPSSVTGLARSVDVAEPVGRADAGDPRS